MKDHMAIDVHYSSNHTDTLASASVDIVAAVAGDGPLDAVDVPVAVLVGNRDRDLAWTEVALMAAGMVVNRALELEEELAQVVVCSH